MGFFKDIFKKKKGGTFVGNLLRKSAFEASGGLFGSGKKLNEWEKQNGYTPTLFVKGLDVNNVKHDLPPGDPSNIIEDFGTGLGKPFADKINKSQTVKDAKMTLTMNWLKKNAVKIVVALVAIVVASRYLGRTKKQKIK